MGICRGIARQVGCRRTVKQGVAWVYSRYRIWTSAGESLTGLIARLDASERIYYRLTTTGSSRCWFQRRKQVEPQSTAGFNFQTMSHFQSLFSFLRSQADMNSAKTRRDVRSKVSPPRPARRRGLGAQGCIGGCLAALRAICEEGDGTHPSLPVTCSLAPVWTDGHQSSLIHLSSTFGPPKR